MNTLLTLLPGASVTYYGEEIGMENTCAYFVDGNHDQGVKCAVDQTLDFGDAFVRSPMQWNNETNAGFSTAEKTWLFVNDNYKELNVDVQTSRKQSHIEIYRHLLAIRKHEAITDGQFHIEILGEHSFAFRR